ncbi:MBL fold metallo-hydrolase [Speluncibacter jeojiensis]|uniref:MBL fold metallo-hydrolase n=1 Tax=Speluncibacter jeojiensis TaxID=2710754 RepID=A0A9X4M541_9ACTN|nr:MBL fold metallo-hydrolase [Corynebacteriales bacterium D3-21]
MSTDQHQRPASPTTLELLGAAGGFVRGMLRPRPVDSRLIDTITDAGLPEGGATVTVRALPQVPRSVPAGGVIEGAGMRRRVRNAMTTFVVEHPEATFLVDPSYCRDAPHRAIAELPGVLRPVVTPPADTLATVDSLAAAGVGRIPDFALPTHAHWDHVCGLLDLPGIPVHLRNTERDWILGPARPPVGGVRSALTDGRAIVAYELDGPPVATFTASHDLFGDGAVILVELAGHTPGSIGVLGRTDAGWVLLAGDAAWHYEQVDRVRQKPAFPGVFVDEDRDAAFAALHRLHLARRLVRVVPTHDHDAAAALR